MSGFSGTAACTGYAKAALPPLTSVEGFFTNELTAALIPFGRAVQVSVYQERLELLGKLFNSKVVELKSKTAELDKMRADLTKSNGDLKQRTSEYCELVEKYKDVADKYSNSVKNVSELSKCIIKKMKK